MKYQITICQQCGNEFKRTNARHTYCSGACRVSAHRDRHGYEQPIFTYPSIRAVEQIRDLNMDDLNRIELYVIWYLNGLLGNGEPMPPPQMDVDLIKDIIKLSIENNDEGMKQILKAVEPLSELLQLVAKIKQDAP
jgi:hypothetical protein